MSDPPLIPRRSGGGLRTRLVLGFGSVSLLTAVLSAITTLLVFIALETYHPYIVSSLAHDVFGSVPTISDTAALVIVILVAVVLVSIVVGVAQLIARRVLHPVGQLAEAADRVAAGDLDVRLAPEGRDELAALVESFNTMTTQVSDSVGELRRREALARRFASDVSHELRSPLAAMSAVTELLEAHTDSRDDDEARATRLVVSSVHRLERLVDDLIEVSRFDAGTAQLQEDRIDVAEATRACLNLRDWTDQVTLDIPAHLMVSVDRRRFDLILANLVGNALRHGAAPVQVSARIGDGHLILTVRDHGAGMAPEVITEVFHRFYKADSARTHAGGGSGLGLAIAQENARLHGGEIVAANAPGGGAIFTLSLPA